MPRRKSLLAQTYEARQKAKLQQQRDAERAHREWLAEQRRIAAQLEKEAAQQRREEERAAQARFREEQQAERARQQAAAKAERLAAQQERERERQAAAGLREERREAEERREQQRREADWRRRSVERRISEAEVRTEAVRAKVAAFERLLLDRNRHLAVRSGRAEDTFNTRGPEAYVDAIQRALATSMYPGGLEGSCAARYAPEARELLVRASTDSGRRWCPRRQDTGT